MEPRIKNPALILPGALPALRALSQSAHDAGLPRTTSLLVQLRASQVNGCSFCVDMHARELIDAGEPDTRVFAVSAWRETTYFSDAERAALALTEAVTRLSDRPDPVPDAVWDEAASHYDERALAALVVEIAAINAWNRLNAATRQLAGGRLGQHRQAETAGTEATESTRSTP
ncbi:MAG: carboxymuconolactone decarboxylase family protein [Dehalococcoidia bacterium]|nr:carboxymuconolactone decarboxylase family protein [Dehalococcoidia bacterium]